MNESPKVITHTVTTGTIVKFFMVVFFLGLLVYLRDILLVFLTSVVIASAIEPVTRILVRRHIPRILAVILIYIAIFILFVGVLFLILPTFLSELGGFMSMLPQYVTSLNLTNHSDLTSNLSTNLSGWQSAILGLSKSESLAQAVQNLSITLSTASGSILGFLSALFGGLTSFLLIIVLSFYLSVQEQGIEQFLSLVTPLKKEEYIIQLWRRTQHKIGRWIQGQLLLALIVGVLVFIALSIMRIEHAFLLAIISGLFEVIPVFGAFIGSVPGILTGISQGGLGFGIVVAFVYLIIQQIESNVIYPIVVQKVLDVEPLVVMIALIVGARLGGFLGILLAVPVAVAITEYMVDLGKDRRLARAKNATVDTTANNR